MVISVKNISPKQGGNGVNSHDDYQDIISNSSFGGITNINSIKPKRVIIQNGDVIDSLQFVYNVVTGDGVSHDQIGNKCGGSGGNEQQINFSDDEWIIGISGSYGSYEGEEVIKHLQLQTSKASYNFGNSSSADTLFTLPVGVFFCSSSGTWLDSLGTYEIVEVPQKTFTETSTKTSITTSVMISSTEVDSSKGLAIGLGVSGFGIATCLAIVAFGLFWKLRKSWNV